MKIEIANEQEARDLAVLVNRGCAHLGKEMEQRGAEIAGDAARLLGTAAAMLTRLQAALQIAAVNADQAAAAPNEGTA